ncbi:MAG: hypothetical protein Q8N05_21655 [Bacteroidota bacterium]|nr:hypothetical protein [Bacteroidota bacterium]
MESRKTEMVEAVGRIILESGINALTIEKLAFRMEIPHSELSIYFEKDTDILKMMLFSLDNEIQQLINAVVARLQSPEEELQNLFKNLYELFNRKPYYLSIIFSEELMEKDTGIHDILSRIKTAAEIYLFQVINQGKQKKTFNTEITTSSLVNKILVSFRVLMNEQRLGIELVRDLQTQRNIRE